MICRYRTSRTTTSLVDLWLVRIPLGATVFESSPALGCVDHWDVRVCYMDLVEGSFHHVNDAGHPHLQRPHLQPSGHRPVPLPEHNLVVESPHAVHNAAVFEGQLQHRL